MYEYEFEQRLDEALEDRIRWMMDSDGASRAEVIRSLNDDDNGVIFELTNECTPFYTYDIWTLCVDSRCIREAIEAVLADGVLAFSGDLDSLLAEGICLYADDYLRWRVQDMYDALEEEED